MRLAHELGYSLRQIAESVRLGRTSVRDYLARGDAAGVLDNPKTGVIHASFYDPVLNPSNLALARHYGIGIVPARVRRPRDKAKASYCTLFG